MTAEITQLAEIIIDTERGLNDLWQKFQYETRRYLSTDSSEEQCTRSAQAGADYRRTKELLKELRTKLTAVRRASGEMRFDHSHPERDIKTRP